MGPGLRPSPTGSERTTFPYKAPAALPRLAAPTDCSFPFSSPGSSAGLECSPCCQAPPLLHGPHPTHFHCRPEPAPPNRINSPEACPVQGLPQLRPAGGSTGSQKEHRGTGLSGPHSSLTTAAGSSQCPDFSEPVSSSEKQIPSATGSRFFALHSKPFPVRLPSRPHLCLLSQGWVPQTPPRGPTGTMFPQAAGAQSSVHRE